MSDDKYIGIRFPFEEDSKGKYFALSKTTKEALKDKISLLLTTPRNTRLYKPDFGADFYQFLFEPIDNQTYSLIREEIDRVINNNISGVKIERVQVDVDEQNYIIGLKVQIVKTEGVLKERDIISITFNS